MAGMTGPVLEVGAVRPDEYDRAVDVWEESVRATHDFVSDEEIGFFRPLVRAGLPAIRQLVGLRDAHGQLVGFLGAAESKVEMLFLHPSVRGRGGGRQLLEHAVDTFGAVLVDVNEENPQAVGFYLHNGFQVVGRSELDSTGKPHPILHLRLAAADGTGSGTAAN